MSSSRTIAKSSLCSAPCYYIPAACHSIRSTTRGQYAVFRAKPRSLDDVRYGCASRIAVRIASEFRGDLGLTGLEVGGCSCGGSTLGILRL